MITMAYRTLIWAALIALAVPACRAEQPAPQQLGSTRNARIAYSLESGRVELTFLARAMSEDDLAELRRAAPNVRVIAVTSRDEALQLAPQVHGIDGRYCSSEFLQAAPKLCWVQSSSAGVERYLAVPELRNSDRIVLTNMQAVHGPTIADHALRVRSQ